MAKNLMQELKLSVSAINKFITAVNLKFLKVVNFIIKGKQVNYIKIEKSVNIL